MGSPCSREAAGAGYRHGVRTWTFSTISSSVPLSASWKLSGLASPSLSRMRTCSSPVLPFLSVYRFVSRFSYTISF